MPIHTFIAGPFETNGYVVSAEAEGDAIAIDVPPEAFAPMRDLIREREYDLRAIVITHGHWDHFGDVVPLKEEFHAPVLFHELDQGWIADPKSFLFAPPRPVAGTRADLLIKQGDVVGTGALHFRVLHVPGHSPGHIALHEPSLAALFSGDLLFRGSIGRVDFPGGSFETIMRSIEEKVLTLPDETAVYSGHGPVTTIGFERNNNPFIIS